MQQAKIGPNKEKKTRKVRAPLSKRDSLNPKMREFTRDLCFQGVGATESDEKLREKFGPEHSPSIRTVYKWRKEMRDGKTDEREASSSEDSDTESATEKCPKPAKRAKMAVEKKLASTFCRDQSLPASSSTWLRHSTRVPMSKSSKIHQTLPVDFLALEFPTKSRKVVSFKPVESELNQVDDVEGTALNGGGGEKQELGKANEEKKGTRHAEPTSSSSSADRGEEQERFVTIFNDGHIELDDMPNTSSSASANSGLRMPQAILDAANALLKLTTSFSASQSASFTADKDTLNDESSTATVSPAIGQSTIDNGADAFKSPLTVQRRHFYSLPTFLLNILNNCHFGKEKMAHKELAMDEQNQLQEQQQPKEAVNNQPLSTTTTTTAASSMQTEEEEELNIDAIPSPSAPPVTAHSSAHQQAMIVPQDENTWFGHSIAAQLREMRVETRQMVKMRIQQVIFECSTTTGENTAEGESEQHLASSSNGAGAGFADAHMARRH